MNASANEPSSLLDPQSSASPGVFAFTANFDAQTQDSNIGGYSRSFAAASSSHPGSVRGWPLAALRLSTILISNEIREVVRPNGIGGEDRFQIGVAEMFQKDLSTNISKIGSQG